MDALFPGIATRCLLALLQAIENGTLAVTPAVRTYLAKHEHVLMSYGSLLPGLEPGLQQIIDCFSESFEGNSYGRFQ